MLSVTADTTFDDRACLARFEGAFSAAVGTLGGAILRDSTPYVPYDTGRLAGSGTVSPVVHTDDGVFCDVRWDAPYAADVYYADLRGVNFRREHHVHARARWFEGAKAVCLAAWTEVMRRAAGQGHA